MPDLRRGELTRRTPLARGAGPERRTGLQRSGQLRRSGLAAGGRIARRTPLTATRHPAGDDPTRFPSSVLADGYQPGDPRTWLMARVGKRAAGRELDGRVWDQYPTGSGVPATAASHRGGAR